MYTRAGSLVLPGDFAAVSLADDVARLISLGEWLNGDAFAGYEHAIFYAGGQGDMILEAEPGGARLVPFHYDPQDCLWSSGLPGLGLNNTQRAIAYDTALHYRDIPYSFADYAALALHRLHVPAPGLRSFIGSTGHMICSQLVDRCRLDLGSHLFSDGRWPGYVTPADLAGLIER
jgi:hypothetical protein